VITRWTVSADDRIEKRETLSFANLGVSRADASAELFLSDDKAYFHDDDSRQIVIWNPRAMEIIGTIPLELEEADALRRSRAHHRHRAGDVHRRQHE
jgi:hypothetical protein